MGIIQRLRKFGYHKKTYGFQYAFWSLCHSFDRRLGLICDSFINERRDKAIIKYLSTTYSDFIESFQNRTYQETETISPTAPIWICWWQGIENMPDIVKACYNSVRRYAGKHPIQVVTKDNFMDFVTLPEHILDKFNSGVISITHLSDILRFSLLYEYGGFWIDATILVTKTILISDYSFFTLKGTYKTNKVDIISQAKWTGFCMAGLRHNILFEYMTKIFSQYWESHREMIDYILIDYLIAIAYNSIPVIRVLIDSVPYNNIFPYSIQYNFNKEFSEKTMKQYYMETSFHKLSRKRQCSFYTKDNKLTFYGYILKEWL